MPLEGPGGVRGAGGLSRAPVHSGGTHPLGGTRAGVPAGSPVRRPALSRPGRLLYASSILTSSCCGQRQVPPHGPLEAETGTLGVTGRAGALGNQLKGTRPGRERAGVQTQLAPEPCSLPALTACPPRLSSPGP